MHTITLTLKQHELKKLKARALRAALPLETYIVNAASDPFRYAWPEDDKSPIPEVKT